MNLFNMNLLSRGGESDSQPRVYDTLARPLSYLGDLVYFILKGRIIPMTRTVSRLQRLEEKRNMNKAVWLILGTFVLIGLTVTIGFNLLTKIFIFMGNVNSTNKPVEKSDFIPPGPPVLLSMYDATNSATISLKGVAEPGATVYLTQNSQTGN